MKKKSKISWHCLFKQGLIWLSVNSFHMVYALLIFTLTFHEFFSHGMYSLSFLWLSMNSFHTVYVLLIFTLTFCRLLSSYYINFQDFLSTLVHLSGHTLSVVWFSITTCLYPPLQEVSWWGFPCVFGLGSRLRFPDWMTHFSFIYRSSLVRHFDIFPLI